ncbi:MAG: hypothetical protein RL134_1761 [Actinomycetota bacterium]
MTRRLAILTVIGAISLATTAPASALPLAPVPDNDSWVSSATNYAIPEQYLAEDALDDFACEERRELPRRSATRAAALVQAKKRLTLVAPVPALRKFQASPIYGSRAQLEGVMALGTINGSLPAALAAALRLASLNSDPRHLINAAVLLQAMGFPDTAADLLAWAKQRPLGEMAGVDGQAAWHSATGGVLLAYGQFPEAKVAYETALAREPLMATARQGIARALHCMGDTFLASKWQGRSMAVVDPLPLMSDESVDPGEAPRWVAVPRKDMIDLTAGKGGPAFLEFTPPQGPNLARGEYSVPVFARWGEYVDRTALGVPRPMPELTPAQKALDDYLTFALGDDPILSALESETERLGAELEELATRSSCVAVDEFGAYWTWIRNNYEVTTKTADRIHIIVTAAAAATGDVELNAYYNAYADYLVDVVYQGFLFGLAGYAAEAENHAEIVRINDDARDRGDPLVDSHCKATFRNGTPGGTYTPDGPKGTGQDASPCSALGPLRKKDIIDVSLPIPGAPVKPKLTINCEEIGLSAKFASVGGPFAEIGLFGGVKYEWFTGDIVLSVGSFAELGPLKVKSGPQLRLGMDANGNFGIKDATFVTKPGLRPPKSAPAATRGTTYVLIS